MAEWELAGLCMFVKNKSRGRIDLICQKAPKELPNQYIIPKSSILEGMTCSVSGRIHALF